jgi:hypothetical protein
MESDLVGMRVDGKRAEGFFALPRDVRGCGLMSAIEDAEEVNNLFGFGDERRLLLLLLSPLDGTVVGSDAADEERGFAWKSEKRLPHAVQTFCVGQRRFE